MVIRFQRKSFQNKTILCDECLRVIKARNQKKVKGEEIIKQKKKKRSNYLFSCHNPRYSSIHFILSFNFVFQKLNHKLKKKTKKKNHITYIKSLFRLCAYINHNVCLNQPEAIKKEKKIIKCVCM